MLFLIIHCHILPTMTSLTATSTTTKYDISIFVKWLKIVTNVPQNYKVLDYDDCNTKIIPVTLITVLSYFKSFLSAMFPIVWMQAIFISNARGSITDEVNRNFLLLTQTIWLDIWFWDEVIHLKLSLKMSRTKS